MASHKLLVALAAVAFLQFCAEGAQQYTVGDAGGWGLDGVDYSQWASKFTFREGDTLFFPSTPEHSVVEVNKADFDLCNTGNALATHFGGNALVKLTAGQHWFICGSPNHCSGGSMKLAINALPAPQAAARPQHAPISSPFPHSVQDTAHAPVSKAPAPRAGGPVAPMKKSPSPTHAHGPATSPPPSEQAYPPMSSGEEPQGPVPEGKGSATVPAPVPAASSGIMLESSAASIVLAAVLLLALH